MPDDIYVLDSSPLILLGKADLLAVISPIAGTWMVPQQVIAEIEVKKSASPFLKDLAISAKVSEIDVQQIPEIISAWDLGKGESETLAAALQSSDCRVVLDDCQARKCAKLLEIPVIGTLGLILAAKRLGYVSSARKEIEKILRCGLYIHPNILEKVYKQINE